MATGDLLDLRTRLGRRRGFDGNTARLTGWINESIQTIWSYRPDWSWARRQVQIQTLSPATSSTATVTNASNTVVLTGIANTNAHIGAMLSTPEGTVYRITGMLDSGASAYLPVLYPGATVGAAAAITIYYDTFPLPHGCVQVEAMVATGNGWEYPIKQASLLPQDMQYLTRRAYESYPLYYSMEHSERIAAPRAALDVVAAGGAGVAAGTYTYWFAYYNDVTDEVGPLSPPTTLVLAAPDSVTVSGITTWMDYRRVIFRSIDGGSEPLLVGRVEDGTTVVATDTSDDAVLGIDTGDRAGVYYGAHRGAFAHKFRVWPPPDDEYLISINYFAGHTELYEDHHTSEIPQRFIPLVLDMAESLALREEEQHAAAGQREQAVMAKLERISSEQDADPGTQFAVGRGRVDPRASFLGDGEWPRLVNQ